jgi:aspartate kinase
MGDSTDDLIKLARRVSPTPNDRELDMLLSTGERVSCALLAMALWDLGVPAVSLTGSQAGIRTTTAHNRARIREIVPRRIMRELDEGRVVIIAGFQGISDLLEVTTLGRGGSDTTAVALAAALGAKVCEIYTDVDGVYSADPRICPAASLISHITYEEMLELASVGARVLQSRSVEVAEYYGLVLHVRSSFNARPGTLIGPYDVGVEERNRVRGIAHDLDVAKVTVVGVKDRPGVAAHLFGPIAEAGISVDVIIQNVGHGGETDISFTVPGTELARAEAVVRGIVPEVGARDVSVSADVAKVSVVGLGMLGQPGIAARMFRVLADNNINIEMISTSEIRITCLVARHNVEKAVRALHHSFELDHPAPAPTLREQGGPVREGR